MQVNESFDGLGERVVTADGSSTIRHPGLDECYHSQAGALSEAQNLYVRSSGLEDALQGDAPVRVLDIGLGLGYNAAATMAAWWQAEEPPTMLLASCECNAALFAALRSGRAPWQADWPDDWRMWLQSLQRRSSQGHGAEVWEATLTHPRRAQTLRWRVYLQDLEGGLPPELGADEWAYIWQDPFSPAKNPALWSAPWFRALGALSAPAATLMTYSVARPVREALAGAGWQATKIPTSGSKRSWLKAQWLPSCANTI